MIFFANAEGIITQSINTPINQGSNGANEVVLICPFSATVITVRYILPNGEITQPYLMGGRCTVGNGLYAYRALLEGAVTRKSGTVTAQFTLWNGGTQLPTVSTSFFVNKGVPDIPMYNGEDELLDSIFTNLTLLEQEITNNVIREYNLGDNNDIGEYGIEFDANGEKEAPAIYNNYSITYGEYLGKTGTLFVFAKAVDDYTIQSEILYADDKVYTRRIDIGEEAEDSAWVCSVDKELSETSTRAISNKAVYQEFGRVKSRLSTAEGEIPIVIDEVLNLTFISGEVFENQYSNSIDKESLNRIPKAGDKAIGLARLKGNAIYSFLAVFQGGFNAEGFCPFTVIESWLIYQAPDDALSLTSRNPVENRAVSEKFADVEASLDAVREIAQGKNTGYVFDTYDDMLESLSDADFVAELKAGDDLFIRDDEQPDYWWDGEEPIPVDAKTDLSNYYNKEQVDAKRGVQNITHLDTIYATEAELPLTEENGTCVVVGSNGVFSLWAYYTGVTGEDVGWKYKYPVRASTIYCVLKKDGQPYNKLVRYTMAPPYFLELSSTKVEPIATDGTPIAKVIVDGEETTIYNGNNGGGGMQSVTYAELKALRDNGQLVAGKQYRITDYECTTTQVNTRSAGHPFDIIVTADSESVLNENARAIQHEEILDVDISEGGVLKTGAVTKYYDIYEDFGDEKGTDYKATDVFVECGYAENNEGVTVPVLYKTDVEMMEEGADYADTFFYVGRYEYDGETYDRWRKIENGDTEIKWDSTGKIYALTNIIVDDNGVFNPNIIATSRIDPYFAKAKLSAWELKYSLDNDKTRFYWADGYWIVSYEWYGDDKIYVLNEKITIDGQEYFKTTAKEIFTIVAKPTSEEEVYCYNANFDIVSFEEHGSSVDAYGEGGKGVIYYMKDEWDNECPYDFKNIQYKRWQTDEQIENDDRYYSSWEDTGNEWMWCYTFMAYNEHTEDWEDASIVEHFEWMNDENRAAQCSSNVIKPYELGYDQDETDTTKQGVLWLNNIVLYGAYTGIKEGEDEFNYYYAFMPQANTFAYNCYNMTFGYFCYSNTFGNNCHSNTFGNNCYSNTFGNNCHSNTFGYYCHSNTFGDDCYSNTFGDECSTNTFGNNCYSNTFDNNCGSNTFGYGCYYNTFGNSCYYNTFGYECIYSTFGNNCGSNTFVYGCHSNTFGDDCDYNTFGGGCKANTFGDDCDYNTFGDTCESNSLGDPTYYAIFESGVSYVALVSLYDEIQNVKICQGIHGSSSQNRLEIDADATPDRQQVFVAAGSTTTEVEVE